jgi:hypothetical protein
MSERIVRIGGAAAHAWDSMTAIPQLLRAPKLDYLVMDCLAEMTISSLARAREVDPAFAGFNADFVDQRLGPCLRDILGRGIKVAANCGGLNPRACAEAITAAARAQGLSPKVAYIEGDDVMPQIEAVRAASPGDMFTGKAFPERPASANVYLGGFPIAQALKAGADIVVTGRVADSALSLGILIAEFGWTETDFDLLCAGTLIGHLMECGQQVTGGTFTDWRDVPDWADIGYPIAECRADGTCVITKVEGTGGLVTPATVAEQMCYEVSDPQAYHVADAACDFSQVRMVQEGKDRVRVSGAVGRAPTPTYKALITWMDGWRGVALHPIIGLDAAAKAERQAGAFIERTRRMLRDRNMEPWRGEHVEILGAEAAYGDHGRRRDAREVVARMSVEHPDKAAVDLFLYEQRSLMCAMSVGSTNLLPATATPVVRLFSGLLDKAAVEVRVTCDGRTEPAPGAFRGDFDLAAVPRPEFPAPPADIAAGATVPLLALAWVRSGDKGDLFNVAAIARRPEYLPYIAAALTPEKVAQWYGHVFNPGARRRVDRYLLPGISAVNCVVHEALGGGGYGSMRLDSVAKGMGQQLLEFPVPVSRALADQLAGAMEGVGQGLAYAGA